MISFREEDNQDNVSSGSSDQNELSGNYNAWNKRQLNRRRKQKPKNKYDESQEIYGK